MHATSASLGPAMAQSAALGDPRVKRCLHMALRRENPDIAPMETLVENAAMMLDVPVLLDGFAACRLALAAFPSEPKVIIAHYNAVEMVTMILFGIRNVPRTDAEAVMRARAEAATLGKKDGLLAPLTGVFLGSAYELGIGTPPDIAEAAKWYRLAADAGSEVARRELDRMLAAAGAKK
jgi:hypothetical protein